MKTDGKPLSIYIHIPFCVRKCLYCDFLSAPVDTATREKYVQCLRKEIEAGAAKFADHEVQTVFIGGGTPSLLEPLWIAAIMETLFSHYRFHPEAEITIEVNPGTVNREKLEAYRLAGINRLSIGLQSADNEELRLLGRIHTAEDFYRTYEDAVKTGFDNINIDLMSAIPGQTMESYRKTLTAVLSLSPIPAHISAYSLIIEEGTPFYDNPPELPDEETDRLLYKITNDILKEKGYHRYEISNYARPGYECRHNKVYWTRGEYVGFGIGAASLTDETRYRNISDLTTYLQRILQGQTDLREETEQLSVKDCIEEFMFLGLRLTKGVSNQDFYRNFGKNIEEVYPGIIGKLEKNGLCICDYNERKELLNIRLSEFGLDVSNRVMAEFLLD